MQGQSKTAAKALIIIGACITLIGLVGLIFRMYITSSGAPLELMEMSMEFGAGELLKPHERLLVNLALRCVPILVIGCLFLGAGFLLYFLGSGSAAPQAGNANQRPEVSVHKPAMHDYAQHMPASSRRQEYNAAPRQQAQQPAAHGAPVEARILKAETGILAGERYRFTHKLVIGRDPKRCHVVFPPETRGVSARHCTLRLSNGHVSITDDNSSFGTFVEGKRVPSGETVMVHRGQHISLGGKNETFVLYS